MNLRTLGRCGLLVAPLTFGAMHLRGDDAGVSPVLRYALERGIASIDTAQLYGGSEALIGRTLRQWQGPQPLLATKVGARPLQSGQSLFCPRPRR